MCCWICQGSHVSVVSASHGSELEITLTQSSTSLQERCDLLEIQVRVSYGLGELTMRFLVVEVCWSFVCVLAMTSSSSSLIWILYVSPSFIILRSNVAFPPFGSEGWSLLVSLVIGEPNCGGSEGSRESKDLGRWDLWALENLGISGWRIEGDYFRLFE